MLKVIKIIIRLWGNQKYRGQTCRTVKRDISDKTIQVRTQRRDLWGIIVQFVGRSR